MADAFKPAEVLKTIRKLRAEGKPMRMEYLKFCASVPSAKADNSIDCNEAGVVVEAMRTYSDACLMGVACAALNAMSQSASNHAAIIEAGAVYATLIAMVRHPSHGLVQEEACETLAHMCGLDDVVRLVVKNGGLRSLLLALRSHGPVRPRLQAAVLLAFEKLAVNAAGHAALVECGAMEATLATALQPKCSLNTYRSIALIIQKLATSSRGKAKALQLGSVEIILEGMKKFPKDSLLQQAGVAALWQLHFLNGAKGAIAAVDGVNQIVSAMARHPSDGFIQSCSCALLFKLSSHMGMRRQMVQLGAQKVIQQAMTTHQGTVTFGQKALRRMASTQELSGRMLVLFKAAVRVFSRRPSKNRM